MAIGYMGPCYAMVKRALRYKDVAVGMYRIQINEFLGCYQEIHQTNLYGPL